MTIEQVKVAQMKRALGGLYAAHARIEAAIAREDWATARNAAIDANHYTETVEQKAIELAEYNRIKFQAFLPKNS